jgi:hypothetical protein
MIKEYKVNKHNSTVCGYPGREFDWSKFDWNQESSFDFRPYTKRGMVLKAPEVYTDNYLIAPNCEYLHVPYNFNNQGTIYRVRPNESMYAGNIYRGHIVRKQTAVKKSDGWYWKLELED